MAQPATGSARPADANSEKAAAVVVVPFDPGFSDEHVAYLEGQVPLIALIEDVARRAPGWGAGTLEASRIDPPAHSIALYWHGVIPEQLALVVTDAAARGIVLTSVQVPYTRAELSLAVDRIIKAVGGVEGLAIGPSPELGGVEIRYPGSEGPTTIDGTNYDSIDKLRAAADAEQAETGIPTNILPGTPISTTDRTNDTSPFWGGAGSQPRSDVHGI